MAAPKGPRGQGRRRVLEAALPLFARYGVRGTSLQMVADELGVTKAAVYHQFPAKEEIALALLEPLFDTLREVVAQTAGQPTAAARRRTAIAGVVDMFLEQRDIASAFYRDPEMASLVAKHPDYAQVAEEARRLTLGARPSVRARVALSVLVEGLAGAVRDEELTGSVDRARLRTELVALGERMLG